MEDVLESMKPKIKKLFSTGFFHIFGSSVINKIIVFGSSVILVRLLSKAEYGIFTSAWNIYSIVLLFNGAGLVNGILQLCSEKAGNFAYVHSIVRYGTVIGLGADVLLAGIMALIALYVPMGIEGTKELLIMLCLLPVVQFIYDVTLAYLRAIKDNRIYSRLSMLNTALYAGLSVIGAVTFREKGLILAHYLATTMTVAYGLAVSKAGRIARHHKKPVKADRISTLKISFVSMMNNGISQLLYLLDIFVLGIVAADETILAGYKIATTIPSALTFIPQCMVIYLYPYFAEHRDDGRWCLRQYKRVVMGVGTVNLFISTGLILMARPVIHIVFGGQYLDAVPIFRLLAFNYFLSGTFRIISGNLLVSQRCLKFNTIIAVISGIVNAVCDYLFINWWGAVGAAYATIAVVLISSILSTFCLIRQFHKKVVKCCD